MAERLARRLDANASDAEALVVRLAPVGAPDESERILDLQLVDEDAAGGEHGEAPPEPRQSEERP